MKLSSIHIGLQAVLLSSLAMAQLQVSTGTPPYASLGGGPFDVVNLGNLNVHFSIPVLHKAGRGTPFTYDVSYDSSIWIPVTSNGVTQWQPATNWGWRGITEAQTGYLSYQSSSAPNGNGCTTTFLSYTYHDAFGALHPFPGTAQLQGYKYKNLCTGISFVPLSSTASDGSGYYLSVTSASQLGGQLKDRGGRVIAAPLNATSGAAMYTDNNGNQISVNGSGVFTDTLGTTALTISGSGTPSSPTTFAYTAPSGATAEYKMNYTQYTVATAFAVSGITEYGRTSVPLVSSITLPDQSSYSFTYEKTPGCTPLSGTYSTNCVTGRILKVTLPTGGIITYGYSGGSNGIESDGSTAGLSRALSGVPAGGTWSYTRTKQSGTPGPGSTWTTTMVDPNGNTTVINFAEDSTVTNTGSNPPTTATYNFYETQRKVNEGSSTLLLTTQRCYNGNYTSCAAATVSSPLQTIDSYSQWPNGHTRGSHVEYKGLSNVPGLVSRDEEYGYGVTMGASLTSFNALQDTRISYASLSNGINDRPSSVQVWDCSSGTCTQISSTSYSYDQPNTLFSTSGTPQHTSITGSRGNLTTLTMSTSGSTSLSKTFTNYDTGNVYQANDVNSATTTYNYSSVTLSCGNSFATSISEPMSLSVSMVWNCTGGVLTQTTDPNTNSTKYTYGDANYWRVTGTSFPDGGSTSTTYNFGTNSPWNVQTSTAKDSSTSVTGEALLDGFGRVVHRQATSDPTGNTDYVDTVYDSLGRVASVSNPYQTTNDPTYGITQYSYDALNRTTAVIHPDATEAAITYTGAAKQVVDEGNNSGGTTHVQKVYQSDGLGRLTSVCEVSGATQLGSSSTPIACGQDIAVNGFLTTYGYDALGNRLSVTQGSLTRSYSYDDLSRITQEVNPESGTTTYTYDTGTAGDLYQRTRPKPNQTGTATVTTTYTHDALHRLTTITYSDSTPAAVFYFDEASPWGVNVQNPKGNLTQVAADGYLAGSIFSYDSMGRVLNQWQCTPLNCGTTAIYFTFNYDYLGDVTSRNNNLENVTYTYSYDTLARLTKLQSSLSDSNHPGTLLTVNTYNPLGEVTKATLGNGIVRTMGYDNRGRTTSLTDGSIYNFTLGYAPDSDILTGNDSINGNWSYSYDDFNRISGSNKNSGAQTFSYLYDRYSNRWQQNAPQGGPAPQYTFNSNNQITTSGVVYDAAGNVTNDGLGNTYTYDAENRVISMSGNSSASYVYDAFGQRVRATISSVPYDFLYSGGRAVDEYTSSGWVWGDAGAAQLAVYANSTTYFSHNDWLGSVRAWSNVSGSSVETCTTMPFGDAQTCTGTAPNSWNYTELPFDSENGMSHALFRQLSTTAGRWTTSDPAGLGAVDPTNPQTWNRYAYVANNPLSFVDPLGLQLKGPCGNCPGSGTDGSALDPMGDGSIWSGALNGTLFNVTQYDFSASQNFQWGQFGLGDLLQFAAEGEISLDAVTPLGVFGFPGGGFGSAGSVSPISGGTIRINTMRLVTKSDYCRGGDRTIQYNLVDMNTGAAPSNAWWVTEHIQAPVPTNAGGTNDVPNQYMDFLSNGNTPYNALQTFSISLTQSSGGQGIPVIVNIGGQDYGTLGLWMSKNPLRNGQPSPNSINCPPQ